MQMMCWTMARLGSRFSLYFEPHARRVMHSALGRFFDRPVDLMVGLVEPDGTERTLPFTQHGSPLLFAEQSERFNSVTFRGYSERYALKFEFNIHSVFYPRDEALCLMPAFYLEVRVHPSDTVRGIRPVGPTPESVELFLRLERPETHIVASDDDGGRIELSYAMPLTPQRELGGGHLEAVEGALQTTADIHERIVSLNTDELAQVDSSGRGLRVRVPVTSEGSGVKWRLVWGSFCGETMLEAAGGKEHPVRQGRLRYTQYWDSLDEVMDEAIGHRDEHLAKSRRMEKLIDQCPLRADERHLIVQSFQGFLSNTFWCDLDDSSQWFSMWDGSSAHHSPLDAGMPASMFYITFWPKLLAMQLSQWSERARPHEASGGAIVDRDLGVGLRATGKALKYDMPIEMNANFLLLHQLYARWTGDLTEAREHADVIERAAKYLIWADRDQSAFPAVGQANSIVDGGPATQFARKQVYLAVKRVAALGAAADLLMHLDRSDAAAACDKVVTRDGPRVETAAWVGDHYAVCLDDSPFGLVNPATGEPVMDTELRGADGYSIYTSHGLLLPMMCNQSIFLDRQHLMADLVNAERETMGHYGCAHTSAEDGHLSISGNLWRDHMARYMGATKLNWTSAYWDLQVMSNTAGNSSGFSDSYVNRDGRYSPRGVTSIGMFLGYPRLVIDRLAPGGARLSVDPDRHYPQRWPLLPLADWKAGKIPVCVIDRHRKVFIESPLDPVTIKGDQPAPGVIG
jgi:hypothetical protein